MRNDKFSKGNILLYCLGIVPVVWLALLAAPALHDGFRSLLSEFGTVMRQPFHIVWCEDSLKTVLIFMLIYALSLAVYLSSARNYRKREEHGSAKWGNPAQLSKKYADRHRTQNKILTQKVAIGLDGRKHRRNLNVLVCGGSGAGKTRFYAKPNIMNANTSFVVLDPNGKEVLGYILQAVH